MPRKRNTVKRARTGGVSQPEPAPVQVSAGTTKRTAWRLLLILILAGGLRFWSLNTAPPGIYHDEAINGIQGWDAAQTGHFKIFYPENYGREGLLINLTGLAEKVMGPSTVSLRLWPAIFGTLTVLGVFILARDLFESDSISLLSAFFIATSFWHLNFSRIAFAGIQMPFFLSWGIGLVFAARIAAREAGGLVKGCLLAAAGGAFFGLGFHSYSPYRFAPFLALTCLIAALPKATPERKRFLLLCTVWALSALALALPLALYFWHNPGDFFARANKVSVWNAPNPLNTSWNVFQETIKMFNLHGDPNWRHNMSESPELLLPVGLLFLLGIGFAANRSFRQKRVLDKLFNRYSLPIWWLLIMLLPEELTIEGIPHALRAIGVVPGVMILAAIGFDWLCRRFKTDPFRGFMATILVLIAAIESYRYFGVWAKDPETAQAFNWQFVEIANQFNALPASQPRFVVVEAGGVLVAHKNPDGSVKNIPMPAQTVMFATLGHPAATYLLPEEAKTYAFPPDAKVAVIR